MIISPSRACVAFALAAASPISLAQMELLPQEFSPDNFYRTACLAHAVIGPDGQLIEELSHNPHARGLPASAIKLLTAVITIEMNRNLNRPVIIPETPTSTKKVAHQKKIPPPTLEYLTKGMLIQSDNGMADQLQRHAEIKTGLPFAQIAGDWLKKIGMRNTRVVEGSGMSNALTHQGGQGNWAQTFKALADHPDQFRQTNVSTPFDMARLGLYAMRYPLIREAMKAESFKYLEAQIPKAASRTTMREDKDTFVKTGTTIPSGTGASGGIQVAPNEMLGVSFMHCMPRDPLTEKQYPVLKQLPQTPRNGFFIGLKTRIQGWRAQTDRMIHRFRDAVSPPSSHPVDNGPQIGHHRSEIVPSATPGP